MMDGNGCLGHVQVRCVESQDKCVEVIGDKIGNGHQQNVSSAVIVAQSHSLSKAFKKIIDNERTSQPSHAMHPRQRGHGCVKGSHILRPLGPIQG